MNTHALLWANSYTHCKNLPLVGRFLAIKKKVRVTRSQFVENG